MNLTPRYLILFASIIIFSNGYSQFHIGVKGGIGFNNMPADIANDDNKNLTTLHVGIFAPIKIIGSFHVIPELQFITKGYSVDATDVSEKYKVKINYIEMPVLMNYKIIKWLSVEAGPSLGLKIGAHTVAASGKSNFINDFFEPIDFGLLGGLRFNITEKLSIISRYNHGLSKILEIYYNQGPNPDNNNNTLKFHNRSIQVSIAYQIR